jgi:cysteine desulfurase
MVTISAHKIHGLKGSALLIKKRKVELNPVIFGGQQEQGLRGGTSNAPADIVLAKTIRLALQKQEEGYKIVSEISNYLREELAKMPGAHVHSPSDGLPYILNISFDQITSEVLLNALDQRGICVSAKSTCSSHDTNASEILLKMGKSEKDATHAIRLSFSSDNTLDEARQFLQAMKEIIELYGLPL